MIFVILLQRKVIWQPFWLAVNGSRYVGRQTKKPLDNNDLLLPKRGIVSKYSVQTAVANLAIIIKFPIYIYEHSHVLVRSNPNMYIKGQ